MKIEAITVSVNHGDFLRESLRHNLPFFDDFVVITSPDDRETRSVCKDMSVRHVLSEDFKRGGPFNKARMINRALDQLGLQEWVVHIDSDIVLPQSFRRLLEWAHPDERYIYGIDRCNVFGWDNWLKIKQAGGWDCHRYGHLAQFLKDAPVGARHVPWQHGFVPIGFFQMMHGSELIDKGFHLRRYPIEHGDAARTDVQFSLQWDRRQRQIIPEVIALHLESEQAPKGTNWRGRQTKRFGPNPVYHTPAHAS